MANRFIPDDREVFVHCISRVVDRNFIFGTAEKRYFCEWMRRLATFCGVELTTYCVMSNHFHLLVRVPNPADATPLTVASLRKLLPVIYQRQGLRDASDELERAVAANNGGSSTLLKSLLQRYENRRHDASQYIKELKQRFTRWYNSKNERRGTLWEERYRSVLVEGGEQALLTMAAYIDLNPVRAGLVDDPKDYPWCGYGEAVSGKTIARHGICSILKQSSYGINRSVTWKNASARYRLLLFDHGEERSADSASDSSGCLGLTREQIKAEFARGGKLSTAEILRCRLRCFTSGAVFGSRSFVDQTFEENREQFGEKRKTGARKMPGARSAWGDLSLLREVR